MRAPTKRAVPAGAGSAEGDSRAYLCGLTVCGSESVNE